MTARGPQEQRLVALLEAREKEIRGVGDAWRTAEQSLDEVERLLDKAKTEVRDAVGGKRSGPKAAEAVQHFHDDVADHRVHLKRASEALSATAATVEHVRGRYAALDGVPARPELKTDPDAGEDKALEDQARHEDAVGAWEAARQERERKCGELAQELEGSLDESIEVMKSIHGEPDGPGESPGAPGAPVTHTPSGTPGPGPSYTPPSQVPGTSTPGLTPGVVTQVDGPGHQVPDYGDHQGPTHTTTGPLQPVGGVDTGTPDYQPPTYGDPGSVPGAPGGSGGSGGPGLGALGMAAGGLVGGAGLAKGISRALGAGSPLSRSARLGPSAVKGAGGTVGRAASAGSPVRGAAGGRGGQGAGGAKGAGRAGAAGAAGGRGARGAGAGAGAGAAGRGRGKGKGRDGQAGGDIFDTEQEWYDDESQPGVLD